MDNRKFFLINIFLINILSLTLIILVINFVFGQNQRLTLFKTENRGFKFITNLSNNAEFKLDNDNHSAYLLFGSSTGFRTVIRPSYYNTGSQIYSIYPNDYGGISYNLIELKPEASSTYFIFDDTSRSGLTRYAYLHANLEKTIAIYNCSYYSWLVDEPKYTCLGKYGIYRDGTAPPGASSTNEERLYINPTTCFGNNKGRILQEICTGDCGSIGIEDDSALTICVLKEF